MTSYELLPQFYHKATLLFPICKVMFPSSFIGLFGWFFVYLYCVLNCGLKTCKAGNLGVRARNLYS